MAKEKIAGSGVGVLGLGHEGWATLKFLNQAGIKPVGLDRKTDWRSSELRELKKATSELRLGESYLSRLDDLSVIVRSPGVPLDLPELKRARRKGVAISSLIQIFFELCPAKVVGVTGTKGKSTTASLIYHLLKDKKRKVYLAGNIGYPPITWLPKLKSTDWVVLELSSFQLEDLTQSPDIAVLLNVVPEHLDRHKNFAKYLLAKQNIYKYQAKSDRLIASSDFAVTRSILRQAKGRICPVSTTKILRKGVYLADGEIVYRDVKTGRRQVVAAVSTVKLRGAHMLQNVLPAIAAAILAGAPVKRIEGRLKTFRPLHHRLELVGQVDQTIFINDSLATIPEATQAAILAFAGQPRALILGGISGGGDWLPVVKTIGAGGVRYVALIGTLAKKLKGLLARSAPKVKTKIHPDFESAIEASYQAVKTGGVVLMSPGAKSFDMFQSAYDRGEQFQKIVNKIIKTNT